MPSLSRCWSAVLLLAVVWPSHARADEYEVWQAARAERRVSATEIANGFVQLTSLRAQATQLRSQRTGAQARIDEAHRDTEARRARVTQQLQRINQHNQRLADLAAELLRALEELRLGMFCSQCHRPRSQIERDTGRSFQEHLTEVHGVPEPATEADYEQVRQHYAQLIQQEQQALEASTHELRNAEASVLQGEQQEQAARDELARIEHEIAVTTGRISQHEDDVFRAYVTWRRLVQVEYHAYDLYLALAEGDLALQTEDLDSALLPSDPFAVRQAVYESVERVRAQQEEARDRRSESLREFREEATLEGEGYCEQAYRVNMIFSGPYWAWPGEVVPDIARARVRRAGASGHGPRFDSPIATVAEYRRIFRTSLDWQAQIGGIWTAPSIVFDPHGPRVLESQSW